MLKREKGIQIIEYHLVLNNALSMHYDFLAYALLGSQSAAPAAQPRIPILPKVLFSI